MPESNGIPKVDIARIVLIAGVISPFVPIFFEFDNVGIDLIKSIISVLFLILCFGFYIFNRLRKSFSDDINSNENATIKILLIHNVDQVDKSVISTFKEKYVNDKLVFLDYYVRNPDQEALDDLKNKLNMCNGAYLFFNEIVRKNDNKYYQIIEAWLKENEDKPFILVAGENEASSLFEKYKTIPISEIENVISIILTRSIDRTLRFIKDARTWKVAFSFLSICFFAMLFLFKYRELKFTERFRNKKLFSSLPYKQSKSLNQELTKIIPDSNNNSKLEGSIREYLNQFIEMKQNQISELLSDESIKISLWRGDLKKNEIVRITKSNSPTSILSFESVAGCACLYNQISDSLIVGWKQNGNENKIEDFWLLQDGERIIVENVNNKCTYTSKAKKNRVILCAASQIQNEMFNIICIDSDERDDIVTNSFANNIAKATINECLFLTNIIPSKFLHVN